MCDAAAVPKAGTYPITPNGKIRVANIDFQNSSEETVLSPNPQIVLFRTDNDVDCSRARLLDVALD